MNFLYNIGIRLYHLGAKIAATRSEKVRKMIDGQQRAIDYLRREIIPGASYIWVHASSLGEFEQGRPLIEKIRRERHDLKILLTFFSPSGYEVRKNYGGVDAVCYLPFDTPARVREFLDVVNPAMAIFVKYEFWGNYLQQLKKRGVPTYIISSIFRPDHSFFKWWGGMFRDLLDCFTHIYVQDIESRQLLASVNVTNVTIAGDTRFDRVTDIMAGNRDIPQAEAFTRNAPLTIVAGSSWQPDEKFLLPYLNICDKIKLIIAPHEVNEEHIKAIESQCNRKVCRLSVATPEEAATADCIIVDCYGVLSSIYRYGDIAYIGGGFGVGIHNINEAAVYGMPVIFGPKFDKFKEAKDLIARGGAFTFSDSEQFTSLLDSLVNNSDRLRQSGEIAGSYIKENLGATDLIFSDIFPTS